MADRDLIAAARRLADSIPEGIGVLRSLDATRLATARTLLGDLADELEHARAGMAELGAWQDKQIGQARRAISDFERWQRIYDPENPVLDLALIIDAVLDERDSLRVRITELHAYRRTAEVELEAAINRKPVGYITAYHTPEGGWSIEFDGEPFPTREAARADLVDAIDHCLPGLECRTLTLYDEEGD